MPRPGQLLFCVVVKALLICAVLVACTTHRDSLNRGQRLYEEQRFDHALAVWRVLEDNADSLTPPEQARYAYLRGMTDYELGYRADARHWLAIAKAIHDKGSGSLSPEWERRTAALLEELNREVFAQVPTESEADSSKEPEAQD